jgi:hypothetical protein
MTDVAAALKAQATLLREQAITCRVMADRIDAMAAEVENGAHEDSHVEIAPEHRNPEILLRDVLVSCGTLPEVSLCDHLGVSVQRLKKMAQPFIEQGKIGRVRSGGGAVYAWIEPDVADPGNPAEARTLGDLPTPVVPLVQRGQAVRGVNKNVKARSKPGEGHRMKLRDKRYAEQQAAKEKRQADQKAKMQQAMQQGKKAM